MNIYFLGMCAAMAVFILISSQISKKVKDANDFYVAGRQAPLLLIAGSMIASYTSTGMFMGDAAEAYEGALAPMILEASGIQVGGYILGAVFFGRYLRRSGAMTIPEFFGRRFCSKPVRILSAVTAIIMMTVYLLSVIQGVGTLMTLVTGVNYNLCIILALIVFTFITIVSGSRGVLITDTLMAAIFTLSMVVSVFVVAGKAGGWFHAMETLAANPETRQLLSWAGKPGALYDTGWDNIAWALSYGVVWMSVCAVGPWQSSRYLMAKDEHTIIRSAPIATFGIFILEFMACAAAVLAHVLHPQIESSSHIWIWIAMNVLPTALGVALMTGVLSAGISSATTFLSLIGASVANDILFDRKKDSITIGRIAMFICSGIVLCFAIANPPAIFVIMFLGGATAASSWMPVAVGSIFSKRMTRAGAFWGMLAGIVGCFTASILKNICGVYLPSWLDPAIIGILCNIAAIVIGSALTQVSPEEKQARDSLFILPESEKDPQKIRITRRVTRASLSIGLLMALILILLWVLPYYRGLPMG